MSVAKWAAGVVVIVALGLGGCSEEGNGGNAGTPGSFAGGAAGAAAAPAAGVPAAGVGGVPAAGVGGVPVAGAAGVPAAGVPAAGAGGAIAGAGGAAGAQAGAGGTAGETAGAGGMAGTDVVPPAGAGGMDVTTGGTGGMDIAGMGGMDVTTGGSGGMGPGTCCPSGDCLCHGPDPSGLTNDRGPYGTDSYSLTGAGCVYYPTDAEPPFAAVTVSDGFLGSGGCSSFQTGQWGPLYASWGIVAMVINTGSSDQPATRGRKLLDGIEAFKAENEKSGSPLYQKLAGRYGTSGFSMGGGGTTYAARDDSTLLTSVAIMPWGPVDSGIDVPSLYICGSSDGTAPCSTHGTPSYRGVPDSVSKMRIVVSSGHNGQPSAGGGKSGEFGLAFQKVFLEGDERWRPLLVGGDYEETNIQ